MKVAIIGLGLIGGSLAIALRKNCISSLLIGVESDVQHAAIAIDRGLVDVVMSIEDAINVTDLIIFCTPVEMISESLPKVLSIVRGQVLMDVGSTKQRIIEAIENMPNRNRFVATHPMWGTEFSGPDAAVDGAFAGKAVVICDRERSDGDALQLVEDIYLQLGMHLVYMNASDHDEHVAYISHISHITSFALANTVLEKEKEESTIFNLASGGFESTVRLAKSNPDTWTSVFKQNRDNVLDVLNEHISQLRKFKACLEKENYDYLHELLCNANKIKKILSKNSKDKQTTGIQQTIP